VRLVVVSGAPGTGKSTVAECLAHGLGWPLLSLDPIKETLGDVLGSGDETWSNRVGDAAAEVLFRLSQTFPTCVVEGWWRRDRRERAVAEFAGSVEVFCCCPPPLAVERMQRRHGAGRHPIHRDVINPAVLDTVADAARTVTPLGVGPLIRVDTTSPLDGPVVIEWVRSALDAQRTSE
jgi:predicted kinase